MPKLGLLDIPIAHRGLHNRYDVPENSLSAFREALHWGLPIELDIHLLADGTIAVFHDRNLSRMTAKTMPVSRLTSRELSSIRLLNTDQKIPRLDEVLELVSGKVPLLIELKTRTLRVGALERSVVKMLSAYNGDYAIQSFNIFSLLWLRNFAPHVLRGQLSLGWIGVPLFRLTQPNFIAYSLKSLPNIATTRLQKRGVPLLAWTIKDMDDLLKARQQADNWMFERSDDIMAYITGLIK